MSGYIPGPWVIAPGQQVWQANGTESTPPVMLADLSRSPVSDDEQDANGRLIAAAPDLLQAAKRALNVLKATGESVRPHNVLGALQAAISKAEGRT